MQLAAKSDKPQDPANETPLQNASRARRIALLLTDFFLGQGALQGTNILIALFLVRNLSVSNYAKFGLASGFQFTAAVLMDLGYASTIIPLVGARVSDRSLVGRYVRAALAHRNRLFWVLSPVAATAFLFVTHRQHWSWSTQFILLVSVLLALYSSGKVSCFGAPLILYRRLRAYYGPQTISGLSRLGIYFVLRAIGALNAWSASVLLALNVFSDGYFLGRKSKQSIVWPNTEDPSTQQEIHRYVLPATPAIILGAFHGQVALFLIGVFGSTISIAQVAALGRLGHIFNLMMTFNIVIVEPYFARLSRHGLLRAYLKFIAVATLGAVAISVFSFSFPGVFLWPLGPQYAQLRPLIGWAVLTACITYVAGLIWIMNRSRKWLFWRGSIAEVGLLVIVQIGFVVRFGMRDTWHAVMFNFASSFCYLVAHTYVAIHGFRKGESIADADEIAQPIP